jgi:methionyl-tRNA synthetase
MLSFATKRFDGKVPEPGVLDDEGRTLLEKVEAGFETVGELYNACKFRVAPSVPSGQAWGRPQLRSNCPADAQRQPWTARRPGSRSRKIRQRRRRRCM